jgi:hypothetical protein
MDWPSLSTSTVGGAVLIAVLGYLGSTIATWVKDQNQQKRERQARLVKLRSILSVTKTLFAVQLDHAGRLIRAVESRDITITGKTWDDRVCCAYKAGLTEDEKVIFSLTRGISYSMQEANASLLKWVRAETYYRVSDGTADRDALAQKLDQLDSHLELWLAKFKNWIPPHPQHAIVFMADEEKHGIGFPKNLDEAVERMLAVEGQTFLRVIDTAAIE